eukprot:7071813-Pyramimonas_sp.AAC.1
MAVSSGAHAVVQAAGERTNYMPTLPCWCTIGLPAAADTTAAAHGRAPPVHIHAEAVVGDVW